MKKSKINIKVKGLLPLFFLLAFLGCKKESTEIGIGLRKDGGGIGSLSIQYTDITCRTVDDDSVRTDLLTTNILGVINDPVFGLSKASLVIQPRLTDLGDDFTGNTIDSIKLILRYDLEQRVGVDINLLRYGDIESEMLIEVFKLDEDLLDTAKYYSNHIPTLGNKVGEYQGKFSLSDSVIVVKGEDTVKLPPQLSITLDNSFGQEMFDFDKSAYSSNDEFLKNLKGLVLVPSSSVISGDGAIVGVEAFSKVSALELYYTDLGKQKVKSIPLGTSSKTINYYETLHTGDVLAQKTGTGHFDKTYAQSLGGTKIKIENAEINDIIEMDELIVINEAKIEFIVDQSTVSNNYTSPVRCWLLVPKIDSSGTVTTFSDPFIDLIDDLSPDASFSGFTNYGGEYSEDGYTFHFNRYLQQLVTEYRKSGKNLFNGFYLSIPADFPVTPSRAVFNTSKANGDVKISITYTKLN